MTRIDKLVELKTKFGTDKTFYHPTTYEKGSEEYARLEIVANYLSKHTNLKCWVQDTYFDFGQDWMWTTIIANDGKYQYQLLSPAEQELILCDDLQAMVDMAKYLVEKGDE